MGKGSKRRPSSVPESVVEENWRRTFPRDKRERLEAAGWKLGDAEEFVGCELPTANPPYTEKDPTS